jgi:hypothetical protein
VAVELAGTRYAAGALMRSMHVWLVGHPSLMRAAWIGLLLILAACQNDSGGGGGGVPGY